MRMWCVSGVCALILVVGIVYLNGKIIFDTRDLFLRSNKQALLNENVREFNLTLKKFIDLHSKIDSLTSAELSREIEIENVTKKLNRLRVEIHSQMMGDLKKLFYDKIVSRKFSNESLSAVDFEFMDLISQFSGVQIREQFNNHAIVLKKLQNVLYFLNVLFIFFIILNFILSLKKIKKIVAQRDLSFISLQKETKTKNTLLQIIAHDINNALTVISMSTTLAKKNIEKGDFSEEKILSFF